MIDHLLQQHQLRSTPARRAVIELLLSRRTAVPQTDLDAAVDADRVTLYRTLKSFEEVGLIHRVADTSGQTKFALCGTGCTPAAHAHAHPHFECEDCGQTYCLPEVTAPDVVLPKGYQIHDTHVTYQGSCASCNATAHA